MIRIETMNTNDALSKPRASGDDPSGAGHVLVALM